MKNINDPMGLLESILESIDQHAAGPELKDAKELENEATEEKASEAVAPDAFKNMLDKIIDLLIRCGGDK